MLNSYTCYASYSLYFNKNLLLTALKLNHTVDQLLELADGQSKLNPEAMREGLVFRPLINVFEPKLGRLSFKAVSNKFLLKYKE